MLPNYGLQQISCFGSKRTDILSLHNTLPPTTIFFQRSLPPYRKVECRSLFSNFYRLTAAAVKNASKLCKLDIRRSGLLLDFLFASDISLLHLRECALPYEQNSGRFLLAHPNIESLIMRIPDGHFFTGIVKPLPDFQPRNGLCFAGLIEQHTHLS